MRVLQQVRDRQHFAGAWLTDFAEDAIRIIASGSGVYGCTIVDSRQLMAAHCDAIQLIPHLPAVPRMQFAGARMADIVIVGNHIRSGGLLQGVFCSDGLLDGLRIQNNVIETNGRWHIALNGLLNGSIRYNLQPGGESCPIYLGPLRIGGGPPDRCCVWVVDFSGTRYQYAPLDNIINAEAIAATVDMRQTPGRKGDIYLSEFDLDGFRLAALDVDQSLDTLAFCQALQHLAREFGQHERF